MNVTNRLKRPMFGVVAVLGAVVLLSGCHRWHYHGHHHGHHGHHGHGGHHYKHNLLKHGYHD